LGFNVRIAAMCFSSSRLPAPLVIGADRVASALLPLQYLRSDLFQPFDVGPLGAVTDVCPGLGLFDQFGEWHQDIVDLFQFPAGIHFEVVIEGPDAGGSYPSLESNPRKFLLESSSVVLIECPAKLCTRSRLFEDLGLMLFGA
jgi:hypothetical protein